MKEGWVIASLFALAAIPVLAGTARLIGLSAGTPTDPNQLRFLSAPLPISSQIHILSSTVFALLGALQFSTSLRRSYPAWHRLAGRVVVAAGLASAASGIWMAHTHTIVPKDSAWLHGARLFFGWSMLMALLIGLADALRGKIQRHQAWMRRAYAIGMGAGTQALTQAPVIVAFGELSETSKTVMMIGAWGLNLCVAEYLNRTGPRRTSSLVPRTGEC